MMKLARTNAGFVVRDGGVPRLLVRMCLLIFLALGQIGGYAQETDKASAQQMSQVTAQQGVSQLAVHQQMHKAPAPLFRDPIYDGAADPVVVYNRGKKQWWMFYTQRRANVQVAGVGWCYGTSIGVAVTEDHGQTWSYHGAPKLEFEEGVNTFWARRKAGTWYIGSLLKSLLLAGRRMRGLRYSSLRDGIG